MLVGLAGVAIGVPDILHEVLHHGACHKDVEQCQIRHLLAVVAAAVLAAAVLGLGLPDRWSDVAPIDERRLQRPEPVFPFTPRGPPAC